MTKFLSVLTGEWWRWRRDARIGVPNPPGRGAPGSSRPASPASVRNCVYFGVEKSRCRSLSGPGNSPCCTRTRALSSSRSCSRCSCSTVNSLWDLPIPAIRAVCTIRCTCSDTCRSNLERVFVIKWITLCCGKPRLGKLESTPRYSTIRTIESYKISSIRLIFIMVSRKILKSREVIGWYFYYQKIVIKKWFVR